MKEKFDKLILIKIFNFCSVKGSVKRIKKNRKKYLKITHPTKCLLSRRFEELPKLTSRKANNSTRKWANHAETLFPEDV